MNWNDILNNLDSMLEHEEWSQPDDFSYALDLSSPDWDEEYCKRVKKFYVVGANWICTDTRVGLAVYLFDGVPVAVSSKPARKSDETVEFVSIEAATKMREYILSLSKPKFEIIDDLTDTINNDWFEHSPPWY